MNNRFKFRIWHKPSKQMYYNDFVICPTGYLVPMISQGDLDFDKQCKLMQSTGLKDKNGKLIYEGDIIRYTEYEIEGIKPEWEYTEIVWGGNHDYPAFDLKVHEFDCNGLSYIFNEGWTIEVIGNVYENKDLLNA